MKAIVMKLVEFYETMDLIDKASIGVIILLILICLFVYFDGRKLDKINKKIDADIEYLRKRYGRSK